MKITKTECNHTCYMCRFCIAEWLPLIAAHKKMLIYKKGEKIFGEGEMVSGIYFINTGVVKVHKKWDNEKELIIRIASDGEILGHRGLGADDIYPVSGTALTITTVCYIDIAFFMATLKVNQTFLYELMLFFASELKVSERKMRNLAHMSVKERVASALLGLIEKFGLNSENAISFNLSRQDLASVTGTTYETVFRMLAEMADDSIIKLTGKDIIIVNRELLEDLGKE